MNGIDPHGEVSGSYLLGCGRDHLKRFIIGGFHSGPEQPCNAKSGKEPVEDHNMRLDDRCPASIIHSDDDPNADTGCQKQGP